MLLLPPMNIHTVVGILFVYRSNRYAFCERALNTLYCCFFFTNIIKMNRVVFSFNSGWDKLSERLLRDQAINLKKKIGAQIICARILHHHHHNLFCLFVCFV